MGGEKEGGDEHEDHADFDEHEYVLGTGAHAKSHEVDSVKNNNGSAANQCFVDIGPFDLWKQFGDVPAANQRHAAQAGRIADEDDAIDCKSDTRMIGIRKYFVITTRNGIPAPNFCISKCATKCNKTTQYPCREIDRRLNGVFGTRGRCAEDAHPNHESNNDHGKAEKVEFLFSLHGAMYEYSTNVMKKRESCFVNSIPSPPCTFCSHAYQNKILIYARSDYICSVFGWRTVRH